MQMSYIEIMNAPQKGNLKAEIETMFVSPNLKVGIKSTLLSQTGWNKWELARSLHYGRGFGWEVGWCWGGNSGQLLGDVGEGGISIQGQSPLFFVK